MTFDKTEGLNKTKNQIGEQITLLIQEKSALDTKINNLEMQI